MISPSGAAEAADHVEAEPLSSGQRPPNNDEKLEEAASQILERSGAIADWTLETLHYTVISGVFVFGAYHLHSTILKVVAAVGFTAIGLRCLAVLGPLLRRALPASSLHGYKRYERHAGVIALFFVAFVVIIMFWIIGLFMAAHHLSD